MSYPNALKIYKEADNLKIEITEHPKLSKGLIVRMFSSAGFSLSEDKSMYLANVSTLKKEKLVMLKQRLKSKNIEIYDELGIFDDAEKRVKEIKSQESRIEIGRYIKKNPTKTRLIIPNFKRKLKPFQEDVVKHNIAVKNGANFSCPGSGKTTMLLAGYSHFKYNERIVDKLLVICPINAFRAWETEYEKCFGVEAKSVRLNGGGREKYYKYANNNEIFLINYSTLCNDVDKIIRILKIYKFMVILDESHYIKNISQEATWANAALNIAEYAEVRGILSGTPAPNDIKDFWTQFTFLMAGEHVFGNRARFLEEIKNDKRRKEMMDKINYLSHRVTKRDLNLPPVRIEIVKVDMTSLQNEMYSLVAEELYSELSKMNSKEAQTFLSWKKSKVIRLRQISSNPLLLKDSICDFTNNKGIDGYGSIVGIIANYEIHETSPKILKTVELVINKIKEGKKRILVWTDFVSNILQLEDIFVSKGLSVFKVFGDIPKEPTYEVCDSFTREGQITAFIEAENSVLIANPQTMAECVSLHMGCHVAIYMDRSFNCAHWMQSKDRIHRVGLDENIITEYFIIENSNSIDEVINLRLNEKERVMNEILDNDIPIATGEFNGKDFGEDDDFSAVLEHIKVLRGE